MHSTPPPDGGYGWIIVLVVMLNFFNGGVTFASFGVLYYEFIETFRSSVARIGLLISMSSIVTHSTGKL